MIEQVSIYLTAMILGIMLFFSFVIAPVVFTTLDEDNARKQLDEFLFSDDSTMSLFFEREDIRKLKK